MKDLRYHQIAGLYLLLGDHADATSGRVVNQLAVLEPEYLGVGPGRLRSDARQIDVASALNEEFAVGQNLRLRT